MVDRGYSIETNGLPMGGVTIFIGTFLRRVFINFTVGYWIKQALIAGVLFWFFSGNANEIRANSSIFFFYFYYSSFFFLPFIHAAFDVLMASDNPRTTIFVGNSGAFALVFMIAVKYLFFIVFATIGSPITLSILYFRGRRLERGY